MTTALDLIKRARRLAGISLQGETPSGALGQAGLDALASMLDSWAIRRLFVYQVKEEEFTWTAGQQSRTVGTAGNFVTDRPSRVDDSTVWRVDSIDYEVKIVDAGGWAGIQFKQATAEIPTHLYPQQGASLMTLYAYPIPSASLTLVLKSWKLLQAFTALTDTVALPPGYQLAIETSLAEYLAVEASKPITPELAKMAREARGAVKSLNLSPPIAKLEIGHMKAGGGNIISGG